jgi:hypothetical protein
MRPDRNPVGNPRAARASASRKDHLWPFYLTLAYLFFVYVRPQHVIPGLSFLRLPAITAVLLMLFLFLSGNFYLKDRQAKLFAGLLALMVVHGPIAVNNYWALMVFIAMVLNFITYLSLRHFVDSEDKYDRLVGMWLKVHLLIAVIGLMKQGMGTGGFLGDENDLCMTLNMALPFTFFLAMSASRMSNRIYYIALACLFLFVIFLTMSRGGFLGLAAAGLYCWLRSKRKFLSGSFIVLFVLFALLVAPSGYWDEVRSIAEENSPANPYGTGAARIYKWKVAWGMFLDNPIMGVGQGNYPWNVYDYELKLGFTEGFHQRSMAGRAAHSLYFTLLPELGLIGTGLFAALLVLTVKNLRYIQKIAGANRDLLGEENAKRYKSIGMALEGGIAAYLVSGIFISVLYYPNLWILMGFAISLRTILEKRINSVNHARIAVAGTS